MESESDNNVRRVQPLAAEATMPDQDGELEATQRRDSDEQGFRAQHPGHVA